MKYTLMGLQRSGTNYFERLMQENFEAESVNSHDVVWKHNINIPKHFDKSLPLFIILKHPLTWVESICLRNKVDWLKRQKKYPADEYDEMLMFHDMNVLNLAKTYKHFVDTWVNNPELSDNRMVIKYEDLLDDGRRAKILKQIETKFGFKRKLSYWRDIKPGRVRQSEKFNNDMKQYYINVGPLKLSEAHQKIIMSVIQQK